MIKWPTGIVNRGWSIGDFADPEAARTARDRLRQDDIDAFVVQAGAVTFLMVRGTNRRSLMLAALYAKSAGEHGDLKLILARLEQALTDDATAKAAFYALLDQTAVART